MIVNINPLFYVDGNLTLKELAIAIKSAKCPLLCGYEKNPGVMDFMSLFYTRTNS